MTGSTARSRRSLSKKQTAIIIVVLLLIVGVGLPLGSRVVFEPWSLGVGGRATLTRDWAAPMQAKLGSEYGLYLDLDYRERSPRRRTRSRGSSGRTNLEGKAAICSRTGDVYEYRVSGRASRSGVIEVLWLEYGDPSLSALNIQLRGPWHADTLMVTANKNPFLPDGRFQPNRPLSSDSPDDSFAPITLQPGKRAAFDAICRQIQG